MLNFRPSLRARARLRSSQAGLSLVELMVALAISVVLIAALSELYVNTSRTNQEMAKTNSQIENARFAIQFLQNEIVHAGYWGSFVPDFDNLTVIGTPGDAPDQVPDPCLAFATPWTAAYIDSLLGIPVQVYNTVPVNCAGVVTNRVAGTDVLVVRHANTCVPGDTNCEADIAGNLYFQASNCEDEIDAGLPYTLDTVTANFTRYERDCDGASGSPPTFTSGTVAAKRKFIQTIYYIRDFAITAGDGIPTLVRSQFGLSGGVVVHQAAEELVQGIEQFRVEVGIDSLSDSGAAVDYTAAITWADPDNLISPTNRGDGIPDGNFVHCGATCTPAQLTNVVAVKLFVLARTEESTPGYTDTKSYQLGTNPVVTVAAANDNFKRHVFSTTIRINNVAGRRETP
jgi:type IV pilus assembly protein PilW